MLFYILFMSWLFSFSNINSVCKLIFQQISQFLLFFGILNFDKSPQRSSGEGFSCRREPIEEAVSEVVLDVFGLVRRRQVVGRSPLLLQHQLAVPQRFTVT